MTTIVLVLLAAAGIGGGIAVAANNDGGGGGSSVEAPLFPGEVISTLAAADRYKNTTIVSNDSYASFLGDIQFGENKILVSTEVPVLENGAFKQEMIDGHLETVMEPQTVEFTAADYTGSDEYADYFSKHIGTWRGRWEGEYIQASMDDGLALGGRVTGLEDSEFGYRKNTTQTSGYPADTYYRAFYAYDSTRLASVQRFDTASYAGNMLGSVSTFFDPDEMMRSIPLAGKANFSLNFANGNLTGNIKAQSDGKEWYSLNINGYIYSPSDVHFQANPEGNVDPSLSDWSFNSKNSPYLPSGGGSGKILSSELVGDLDVSGFNAKDKYVTAYMVFGAKEIK